MEVLILLIAVSLVLATAAVGFFTWTVIQRTHEHSDRLTLLPLDSDESSTAKLLRDPLKEGREDAR